MLLPASIMAATNASISSFVMTAVDHFVTPAQPSDLIGLLPTGLLLAIRCWNLAPALRVISTLPVAAPSAA
jgi:hypothetical protein